MKNHKKVKKIETLEELKQVLNSDPSVYLEGRRVQSCAFIIGMPFCSVINWLNRGIWTIKRKENKIQKTVRKIAIPIVFLVCSCGKVPVNTESEEIIYHHKKELKDWNSMETPAGKRLWLEKINNFSEK